MLTFFDSDSDHILDSEGACLEQLLEAHNIVLMNSLHDKRKPFTFVIVVVIFYWRRSEKDIVTPYSDTLRLHWIGYLIHYNADNVCFILISNSMKKQSILSPTVASSSLANKCKQKVTQMGYSWRRTTHWEV
jgi:hypothetical protein